MADMRLVVAGAAGRMGRMLVQAIHASEELVLAGALERKGSPALGQDIGTLAGLGPLGISITDDPLSALAHADGVIDFTAPQATLELAAIAAQARIVHVIGTTGLSAEDLKAIDAAGRHAVIIRSGNMSLGVNLLAGLVRRTAKALGIEYDIEIVDMHHRMKVDAPSGTALMLGEAAAEGRGISLQDHSDRGRDGITGARKPGDIGFAALRGGTVIGDHTVTFAGPGERIELSHRRRQKPVCARRSACSALGARSPAQCLFHG